MDMDTEQPRPTDDQTTTSNMFAEDERTLLDQLDRTLESAGIHLGSEIRDGAIILSGQVIQPGDHQAALDVAHAVADPVGLAVEDAIEEMDEEVESSFENAGGDEVVAYDQDAMRDAIVVGAEGPLEIDPDFTGDVGTTDAQLAAEEGVPYFPPTDPVVRVDDDGNDPESLEVVGGFAESSMEEDDDPATVFPSIDDDVAEAVVRELRQDAATADLVEWIRVSARGGIVTLTGRVETLEDADEVAAVAERVDGVVEVQEELDVTLLPHPEDPDETAAIG